MRIMLFAGQNGRAVIVGDVDRKPVKGRPVTLKNARMVLYCGAECGGFFGMCAKGPKGRSRITAPIDWTTETVWQEVNSISEKAAEEFDKWPAV
jgi:hypothetical protein